MKSYAEVMKAALDLTTPEDVGVDDDHMIEYEEYVRGMAELIADTMDHGFSDSYAAKEAIMSILSGGRF